ncbi:MAG: condensation domain-containing protein [Treponema sp.]|jgi:NRPS condensation-like uncharacterized protein|nr:condensation domain-containing protein [Treponema sp.]
MNERLYLRSPSINVCFRVIIGGTLDKNKVKEALEKICIKHPLLNCSLKIDNGNNAWLVQSCGLSIECYKSTEIDWQTWYKTNDNIPFDFLKGPLVKFCVINGKDTEIIILGHHIIGDGIGYLNLVKDILLALDNKIDANQELPPFKPEEKYFKETILLEQPAKDYAQRLNGEWRKNRTCFTEKDYNDFFKKYRKTYNPNLYTASLEGDSVKKLLEKSKSNGLTVNEVITSAFSVALMETLDREELRVGVAANIRNDLVSEPNNCMGNFVTGIAAKVTRNLENDFISKAKDTAIILKEQLLNTKNRHLAVHFLNEFDKDLIESIMFAAYGNFEHHVSKKLAELIGEQLENKGLGISNLGKYDFNNYENINVLDIQFIGPAFPANLLTVGIITVNNKVNVCFRFNESEIKEKKIKKIFEKALEIMNI